MKVSEVAYRFEIENSYRKVKFFDWMRMVHHNLIS